MLWYTPCLAKGCQETVLHVNSFWKFPLCPPWQSHDFISSFNEYIYDGPVCQWACEALGNRDWARETGALSLSKPSEERGGQSDKTVVSNHRVPHTGKARVSPGHLAGTSVSVRNAWSLSFLRCIKCCFFLNTQITTLGTKMTYSLFSTKKKNKNKT